MFNGYNVHNLVHLADDAALHGSLDSISAFPFENHMQKILAGVRMRTLVLEQVVRRTLESRACRSKTGIESGGGKGKAPLRRPHLSLLQVPEELRPNTQFQELNLKDFTIKLSERDSCITVHGNVGVVENILQASTGIYVAYRKFSSMSDFFTTPLQLSLEFEESL